MKGTFCLLFGLLSEILSLFIFVFTIPLGFVFPLTGVNKNPTHKNPIVFIHGWLNQNLLFYFLKRCLEKQGYKVFMADFGLLTGNIGQNTQLLSDYIKKNNLGDVILVGASTGAIIGIHYLQKLGGWNKVDRFIAVSGPFMGFPLARIAFFSKSAKQMIPNSEYLKSLFYEKVKNIEKIVCISSKYDEIVPHESSKIPGAKNEAIEIVGHVNLLAFSNQTHELIAKCASF